MSTPDLVMETIGGITWHYRPETNDRGIIQQNFEQNANALPTDVTGWRVLDIGAHIGSFAILAALRGATVTAYEPVAANCDLLLRNAESLAFRMRPAIVVVQRGIGRPAGARRLYTDPYNTGLNSTSLIYGLTADRYEHVAFVTLGEALAHDIRGFDFVKMDVEGGEYDIIDELVENGLHVMINRLQVSFHIGPAAESQARARDQLREFYDIERLGGDEYLFQRKAGA